MNKSRLLTTVNPALADEWHPTLNILDLNSIYANSGKSAWWVCQVCSHEWPAQIAARNRGNGCPNCAGKVVNDKNSLAINYPEIAKQFHPTKNTVDLASLTYGSKKRIIWLCEYGHEWPASPDNRASQNDGCPYCSGRYPTETNNLLIDNPSLSLEFDLVKNFPKTPKDFTPRANKTIWWLCPEGHSYPAIINDRNGIKKTGCKECRSLAFVAPGIAKEYSVIRNPKPASQVYAGSTSAKVWWQCSFGHEWEATPGSRTNKKKPNGCPECSPTPRTSKIESVLRDALRQDGLISNIQTEYNAFLPIPFRQNNRMSVDIAGNYRQNNIVVEYDSWYWHSGGSHPEDAPECLARDTAKTQALLNHGYLVVRIREFGATIKLDEIPIDHPNLLQLTFNYTKNRFNVTQIKEEIYAWLQNRYSSAML